MSLALNKQIQFGIKRIIDLCLAVIILIVGFPLFLSIALYIKINSDGSIIFVQERAGMHGAPFMCYKFRTMTEERGIDGNFLPDQYRLKAWGSFLRKTSLDELPQIINVFKGEMSFIGPRPLPVKYLSRYSKEQMRRHEMQPGITGWTGVNGRNNISWESKFRMDVWYIDNWSLWLDCKIFCLTFIKIIKRDGVNKKGYATRDEFWG